MSVFGAGGLRTLEKDHEPRPQMRNDRRVRTRDVVVFCWICFDVEKAPTPDSDQRRKLFAMIRLLKLWHHHDKHEAATSQRKPTSQHLNTDGVGSLHQVPLALGTIPASVSRAFSSVGGRTHPSQSFFHPGYPEISLYFPCENTARRTQYQAHSWTQDSFAECRRPG